MPFRFRCPADGCGKTLEVSDGSRGRKVRCPACRALVFAGNPTHGTATGARPAPGLPRRFLAWVQREPRFAAAVGAALLALAVAAGTLALGVSRQASAFGKLQKDNDARRKADADALADAADRELRVRTDLYARSIAEAQEALDDGDLGRARAALDGCPDDLRGWEWGWLIGRCGRAMRVGTAGSRPAPMAPPETHRVAVAAGAASCLAFGGDGRLLALGGRASERGPAECSVVDLERNARLFTDHPRSVKADVCGVAFRPDGGAVVFTAGRQVKLWDDLAGKPRPRWDVEAPADVRAVAFNPDGRSIAVALTSGALLLRDAADGRPVTDFGAGAGDVQALAFNPDGDRLAGSGSAVRVWDAETGRRIAAFDAIAGPVVFSADGAFLLRRDGRPGVWNAATGEEVTRSAERQKASPYGRTVEGRAGKNALLYDVRTAEQVAELPTPAACHAFSADGKRLAVGSGNYVLILDAETADEAFGKPEPLPPPRNMPP